MSDNQSVLAHDDDYTVGSREVLSRLGAKVMEASQSKFRSPRCSTDAPIKGRYGVASRRRKKIGSQVCISLS